MTKRKPESDTEKYLCEVRSWETDRVLLEQKSRQIAWRIAGVSLFLTVLSVAAVAMLVPLKTVEPYVIRVDNTTGIVDVARALNGGDTTYNEAINKYFAQIYVRSREGYYRELSDTNYRTVGLLSNGTEQQRYYDYFTPKNAQSPLHVYGKYAKVNITVKSTSFVKSNVALVRYVKEVVRGTDRPELSHWASTVTFKYVGAPMSDTDRAINPLGFQVTDYRTDPESLTAVEKSTYQAPQPQMTQVSLPASAPAEPHAGAMESTASPGGGIAPQQQPPQQIPVNAPGISPMPGTALPANPQIAPPAPAIQVTAPPSGIPVQQPVLPPPQMQPIPQQVNGQPVATSTPINNHQPRAN